MKNKIISKKVISCLTLVTSIIAFALIYLPVLRHTSVVFAREEPLPGELIGKEIRIVEVKWISLNDIYSSNSVAAFWPFIKAFIVIACLGALAIALLSMMREFKIIKGFDYAERDSVILQKANLTLAITLVVIIVLLFSFTTISMLGMS